MPLVYQGSPIPGGQASGDADHYRSSYGFSPPTTLPTALHGMPPGSQMAISLPQAAGPYQYQPDGIPQSVGVPYAYTMAMAGFMMQPPSQGARRHRRSEDGSLYKVFVGQLPKTWTETQLMTLFADFGTLHEVVIIRHKDTGESRGCGFVNFVRLEDAQRAIDTLHNSRTCTSMSNPLQVRFASGTRQATRHKSSSSVSTKKYNPSPESSQHKLFVGMLPKHVSEVDLHQIFDIPEVGEVDEITILRDQDLQSKGCAFVRMKTHQQAEAAIHRFNGKYLFPGTHHPCVCRWADSERQKKLRRLSSAFRRHGGSGQSSSSREQGQDEQSRDDPSQTHPDTPALHLHYPFTSDVKISIGTAQFPSLRPLLQMNSIKSFTEGPEGANLLITGIGNDLTDVELGKLFASFGTVISAQILIVEDEENPGKPRPYGLVAFNSPEAIHSVRRALA